MVSIHPEDFCFTQTLSLLRDGPPSGLVMTTVVVPFAQKPLAE